MSNLNKSPSNNESLGAKILRGSVWLIAIIIIVLVVGNIWFNATRAKATEPKDCLMPAQSQDFHRC